MFNNKRIAHHRKIYRNLNILYWVEGFIVLAFVLLLHPIDDDWFFLRYFPNANEWGIGSYKWLNDCILLKRDYWRPIEDIIMTFEARYAPWLFPWLQHILIVTLAFGSGWSARCLGIKAGASPRAMTAVCCVGMLAATNLGSLTSIDSLTQVGAAFWGLLSIRIFASKLRPRYLLWVVTVILACLHKETGFVFAMCGPVYKWFINEDKLFAKGWMRCYGPALAAGVLLTVVYLGVYFTMSHMQGEVGVPTDHAFTETVTTTHDESTPAWDQSQKSHRLTPMTLIKNLAILYGLGLYPVAVSGFYYHNYLMVLLTLALGWGGIVLLWRMWRRASGKRRKMFVRLLLIGIYISAPSLITRAGEISPMISNMLFIAATGVLATGMKINKSDIILGCLFVATTLITDGYKYSLALRGGMTGLRMGREAAALTPADACKVLWVGVDESGRDRAGAAFNKSPYKAFDKGNAALRELGYPRGLELYRYTVSDQGDASARADSIANALAPDYDCVWLTSEDEVRVVIR